METENIVMFMSPKARIYSVSLFAVGDAYLKETEIMLNKDVVGKKFNNLKVLGIVDEHPGNGKHIKLICKCGCGKITYPTKTEVINGRIKSCGCLAIEKTIKRNLKHGYYGTRIYRIWNGILERTKYKSEKDGERYWKRGISVCCDWEKFENFKEWAFKNGYKDNLTIDRIDVNGNYCPENCRWATIKEQTRNKTTNKILEYKGIKMCLTDWANKYNLNYQTLQKRLKNGWNLEKALNTKTKNIGG